MWDEEFSIFSTWIPILSVEIQKYLNYQLFQSDLDMNMLQDEIVSCAGNYFIMGSLTLNSLSGLCFEWVLVVKLGWSGLCFNGLYQCISSQNVGGL